MEIDFDSWEDYVPITDINQKIVDNPNVLKLKKDDEINFLEIDRNGFIEIFDNCLRKEEEYNSGVLFIRLIKDSEVKSKGEIITIFNCPGDDDIFVLRKNNSLYFLYVYESNEWYKDGNKITFTGWDYNIIVNLDKMTAKTVYVR